MKKTTQKATNYGSNLPGIEELNENSKLNEEINTDVNNPGLNPTEGRNATNVEGSPGSNLLEGMVVSTMENNSKELGLNSALVEEEKSQENQGLNLQTEDGSQGRNSEPINDVSNSMEEPETDDDDFQVVQKKKGKSKVYQSNLPSPIVTRNASKDKAAQRSKGDATKGIFKGGGGVLSSSSDT